MKGNRGLVRCGAIAVMSLSVPTTVCLANPLEEQANQLLGLSASVVLTLDVDRTPGVAQSVAIPIDGESLLLNLVPHSVRSEHFEVRHQFADGSFVVVDPGPARTVRGVVAGIDGSVVAGSVTDDGLLAVIDLPDGRRYWVEPLFSRVQGATEGDHAVYRDQDVLAHGGSCATEVDALAPPAGGAPMSGAGCDTFPCVAELACDADYEYYLDHPSAAKQIESIINTVNIQYERDVDITHVITTIIVRTAEPDAYSSFVALDLLVEFRNEWLINQQDVVRDLAQLFTGKDLDGGTVGAAFSTARVCLTGDHYSIVQSDFSPNFKCVTNLSAHELGHVWGADHCTCPDHTMNPSGQCANQFHPVETIPEIIQLRDSSFCLGTPESPPQCDPPGPDTKCWDAGGDGILFSNPFNWDPDEVPTGTDDVVHPTGGDVIQMDVGTPEIPDSIKSFTMTPDGTAGLTVQSGRGLSVAGFFDSDDPAPLEFYNLTVQPGSLLDIQGIGQGFEWMRHVNVTLLDTTPGDPTNVRLGTAIGPGSWDIRAHTRVDAHFIDLRDDPARADWTISGTLVVDGVIVGAKTWTLSGGAFMAVANGRVEVNRLLVTENALLDSHFLFPSEVLIGEELLVDGQGAAVNLIGGDLTSAQGSLITLRNGALLRIATYFGEQTEIASLAYGVGGAEPNLAVFGEGLEFRDDDSTQFKSDGPDSVLKLEVENGDLEIRSKVHEQASAWDATGVDLLITPPASGNPLIVEATSPDFMGIWFADSPCVKAWNRFEVVCAGPDCFFKSDDNVEFNSNTFVIQQTGRDEAMYVDGDVIVDTDPPADLATDDGFIYLSGTYTGPDFSETTFRLVDKTLYGDFNNDCKLDPFELLDLRRIIAGVSPYDPLFDLDCDGAVTQAIELARFKNNVNNECDKWVELCGSCEWAPCCGQSASSGGDQITLTEADLGMLAETVGNDPDSDALAQWIADSMTADGVIDSIGRLHGIANANPGTSLAADAVDLAEALDR